MSTWIAATPPRLCDRPLRPPVVVARATPLCEAARLMREHDVSSVLVGRPGELVAILTERDLVDALAEGRGPESPVDDLAVADPLTVPPEESVQQAAVLMLHHGVRHLVVVAGRQAIGVVSIREALELLVSASNAEAVFAVVRQAVSGPTENWLG